MDTRTHRLERFPVHLNVLPQPPQIKILVVPTRQYHRLILELIRIAVET